MQWNKDIVDQVKSDIISQRANNSKKLKTLELVWNQIEIDCAKLGDLEYLQSLTMKVDSILPAVYIFEVKEQNSGNIVDLVRDLQSLKKKKKGQICTPFIPDDFEKNESQILYCGSVKRALKQRLKEHLGIGSKSTYSLQLRYWAESKNRVEFQYAYLERDLETITELIESLVSNVKKPLVGKQVKGL